MRFDNPSDKRFIPPSAVSKWRISYNNEKYESVVYSEAPTAYFAWLKSCIHGIYNGEMISLPFHLCTITLV